MQKTMVGLLVGAIMMLPMAARAESAMDGTIDKMKNACSSAMKGISQETPANPNYGVLKLGYFLPNNDEEGLKDYKKTWDVELGYGYLFTKNVALEVGGTYLTTKYDKDNVDAKMTTYSIPVTAKFIYPVTKDIDVFAGAGVGYYFASLEAGDETERGKGWGYHAVAGADYKVMENVALGMELKWNQAKVKNDDWDDKLNVGGTSVKLAAKYLF